MIFKKEKNTKAEEFRKYIAVNVSLSFDNLEPYIDPAERKYLTPLLGKELYDQLITFYNNNQSEEDSELWNSLLHLCQHAVINLALLKAYPVLNAHISDSGISRAHSKEKALYKYQEDLLIDSFKEDGFNGLDDVLAFLEDNINKFPKWKKSDNYTLIKSSIIKSTAEFNAVYNIGNSRIVFLQLKPYINQVVDLDVPSILGEDLTNRIITSLAADTPDEKITNLLPDLRKTIVFSSIALGVDEMGLNVTERGMLFSLRTEGDGNTEQQLPDQEYLAMLQSKNQKTANKYFSRLVRYITSHAEDYPEFTGDNSSPFAIRRDNSGKKTVWLM